MAHPAYNPQKEEIYSIKGDMNDGNSGVASHLNLTKTALARVPIRYKDRITEGDLYRMPGDGVGKSELMLNLYCPKCANSLQIRSSRKQMDWDGEFLSVEAFSCTWEAGRSDGTKNDRIEFGAGLCRWRVGINKNVAKDA